MAKNFILSGLMMVYYLVYPVFGCDDKALDDEAQAYSISLWSNNSVPSCETIQESLYFLGDKFNNNNSINIKYTQEENFNELIDEVNITIKNNNFKQFSSNCQNIYQNTASPKNKAAVYMLLERVQEEFLEELEEVKRFQEFQRKETDELSEEKPRRTLADILARRKKN